LDKCSILIPTYNERDNIQELTKRIWESLSSTDFEVIFIDDDSPDNTAEVAEKLSELYGDIKVLKRPDKLGLASAVLDGMRIAEGNIIAVMDADLQHPPELLPVMLEKAKNGCDIVVASRNVEGGGVEGWSLIRRLESWGATKLAHLLLPKSRSVRDPMSGFFMFRRRIIDNADLNPTGYKILLEILIKGDFKRVTEVPYIFKPRKSGKSKLGLREILRYLIHIFKLKKGS